MELDKVKQFLDLESQESEIEERLKAVKRLKSALEKEILDEFEKDGVHNIKLNGRLVYLYRKVVARPKNGKESVIDALRSAGLEDLLNTEPTYNTNTLDAFIRDAQANEQPIPAALQEALEVTELFFVRTRKA